jgi:hypothetical protein
MSTRNSLALPDDEVPSGAHTPMNRFTLDSVIEDEGGNLSIGQVGLFAKNRLDRVSKLIVVAVSGFTRASAGKGCQSDHP